MGRLFQNGHRTIAVVMGNTRGGFIERCWESLSAYARVCSCNLLALPGELDEQAAGLTAERCDEAYAFAQSANVDGVVVIGSNLGFQNRYQEFISAEGAARLGIPVAVLGRDVPGLPCALMDNESGVREAILHFIDHHGFRRIGIVKGREGHPQAEARYAAYCEALASRGIALDPTLVYPGNFSYNSGIRATRQILQDGLERMDALFASNDDIALGIVRGLHLQGLSVPSDMRLIGFDDSCEGQSGLTHIATVRQPIREMVEWATDAVLDPAAHGKERVRVFPSKLVTRSSCGCTTALRAFLPFDKETVTTPFSAHEFEKRLEAQCEWLFHRAAQETLYGLNGREAFVASLRRFSEDFRDGAAFSTMLEELESWLIRLVRADDEITDWETCLGVLRRELMAGESPADMARARGAFLQLRAVVEEARGNKRRIERFRSNFTQSLRSEALLALAAVDNLEGLRASLEKQLPDLGVSRYLLSLFVMPDAQAEESQADSVWGRIPVSAFQGDTLPECAQILFSMGLGIDAVRAGGRHFPTLELLPEGQQFAGERMDLLVEPLFFGSDQYGYQISEVGSLGENLYDTIRPQIAAALHTIGLIRQLRDALDSLRRAQRQLVQSEKMASLGTLVAGFAHELNTPIGISITAASFLQRRMGELQIRVDQDELRKSDLEKCLADGESSLNLLMANLGKASELVSSFKRVAADQASELQRTFGLRQYLQQILSSLRPRLNRVLPAIEVICPENLIVDTYPGALFQVVSNLLLNTVMHAYPDGKAGRASITARREGVFVHLRYEDDGIGIPEELREKVFDPFFTTARSKGGTGIGLHIAYNAVTQMLGGSISCEASPTGGVRFDVRMLASNSTARGGYSLRSSGEPSGLASIGDT